MIWAVKVLKSVSTKKIVKAAKSRVICFKTNMFLDIM